MVRFEIPWLTQLYFSSTRYSEAWVVAGQQGDPSSQGRTMEGATLQTTCSCGLTRPTHLHSSGRVRSTKETKVSTSKSLTTAHSSHSAFVGPPRAGPSEYFLPDDVHGLESPGRQEDLLWCPRVLSRRGHVLPPHMDDEQPLPRGGH